MNKVSNQNILGMKVDVVTLNGVVDKVQEWTSDLVSYYVCVSNVHMCMECFDNSDYRTVVNSSDMTIPDGKPIFLAQQMLGSQKSQQVRGEDLTNAICEKAEKKGLTVGFFGATNKLLEQLNYNLKARYPNLKITYSCAPPFRQVTTNEDRQYIEDINKSGVDILFVGLGCPKQEIWMADHKEQLTCVMIGVGAAFDFIAGRKKQAPQWMQKIGLEWLFRLGTEPRRLWWRYLKHNPRFIWYLFLQLLGRKYS